MHAIIAHHEWQHFRALHHIMVVLSAGPTFPAATNSGRGDAQGSISSINSEGSLLGRGGRLFFFNFATLIDEQVSNGRTHGWTHLSEMDDQVAADGGPDAPAAMADAGPGDENIASAAAAPLGKAPELGTIALSEASLGEAPLWERLFMAQQCRQSAAIFYVKLR